jgi:hypothetical protein
VTKENGHERLPGLPSTETSLVSDCQANVKKSTAVAMFPAVSRTTKVPVRSHGSMLDQSDGGGRLAESRLAVWRTAGGTRWTQTWMPPRLDTFLPQSMGRSVSGSANAVANETPRNGGRPARSAKDASCVSLLVVDTHRSTGDRQDGRRSAHNPAPPTCGAKTFRVTTDLRQSHTGAGITPRGCRCPRYWWDSPG